MEIQAYTALLQATVPAVLGAVLFLRFVVLA